MAPVTSHIALAALLGMLVAGCGGGSDRATSPTETGTTTTDAVTTTAPPSVERYLLQADEVPGLEPMSSPQTDSGEPFPLPTDGAEQLRRSGYISTTYQPAQGDRGAGVSSVLLFDTEAGARDW